jgi:hypothetical protein
VRHDCGLLRKGGVEPTRGDLRCILFGHLIRLAIRQLGPTWDAGASIEARLAAVGAWVDAFGGPAVVEAALAGSPRRPDAGEDNAKPQLGAADAHLPV